MLLTATYQYALGYAHAIAAQIVVQYELVEGHRFHQYVAGRVGDVNQFEVALQDTILARSAVNGDVCIVEETCVSVLFEREVVLVDRSCGAVGQFNMPIGTAHVNDIHVVALFVHKRIDALSRAQ